MRPPATRGLLPLCVLFVALSACAPDPGPGETVTDPARVSISAAVDDDIVAVSVGELRADDGGTLDHTVTVEWRGDVAATLDDARFTHHVSGQPGGELVLAGRGCGAQWDAGRRQVVHPCTMDLLLIALEPGESHDYPARIHPAVGPLRLTPGTYVVEENIGWQSGGGEGRFTITLTYVVE